VVGRVRLLVLIAIFVITSAVKKFGHGYFCFMILVSHMSIYE